MPTIGQHLRSPGQLYAAHACDDHVGGLSGPGGPDQGLQGRRATRGDGQRRRRAGGLPAIGRVPRTRPTSCGCSTSRPAPSGWSATRPTLGSRGSRRPAAPHERALRERLRLSAGGIGSYATDPAGRVAAFALGGTLVRADLVHRRRDRRADRRPGGRPAARPDRAAHRVRHRRRPAGARSRAPSDDALLAGERATTTSPGGWPTSSRPRSSTGTAATGGRPDGRSVLAARVDDTRVQRWHLHDPADPAQPPQRVAYPPAGTANAEVTLHLLDLDGGWVDVHWDRETYPYLVGGARGPSRRAADHRAAPAAAARAGAGRRPAHRRDPGARRAGRPALGRAGRRHAVLPARRPGAGRRRAGPRRLRRPVPVRRRRPAHPGLAVRAAGVRAARGTDLLVEASEGEPSEQHLYRVGTRSVAATAEVHRLTTEPGWHVGHVRRRDARRRQPVAGAPGHTVDRPLWRRRAVATLRIAGRPAAVRAAARPGAGDRPAAAGGRALPARPRRRPPAARAGRRLRRPGPPGGRRGPGRWLRTAVVGRRRVRGGRRSTTGVRRAWRRRSRR